MQGRRGAHAHSRTAYHRVGHARGRVQGVPGLLGCAVLSRRATPQARGTSSGRGQRRVHGAWGGARRTGVTRQPVGANTGRALPPVCCWVLSSADERALAGWHLCVCGARELALGKSRNLVSALVSNFESTIRIALTVRLIKVAVSVEEVHLRLEATFHVIA